MNTHEAPATAADRRALLRARLEQRVQQTAGEAAADQPVSAGQRALWLFSQMHPDSPAYNLCFAARVTGPLDTDALGAALRGLFDHHTLLRTALVQDDGELRQRVRTDAAPEFSERDMSDSGVEEVERAAAEFAERPFDLGSGVLLRAQVLRLGPDTHVLLVSTHHIASDLWSFGLLVQDLQRAYPAAVTGAAIELPHHADYSAYVRWQRDWLAGPRGRAGAAYWDGQLGDEPTRLELPTDRPRPAHPSHRAGAYTFTLDASVTEALKQLARETGATPYAVLLSVFTLLMHRYTGQRDIWLGSVASGRSRAAFEDIVGYFANLIVLRSRVEPGETFRELVERAKDTVLDGLEHQDFPFPMVAQRARERAPEAAGPLFDVAFYYESASWSAEQGLSLFATGAEGARIRLGNLVLEPWPLTVQGSEHDLTLFAEEVDGKLSCSLRYALDLFDRETAERMAGHFRTLAAACAAGPDERHSELPMLSAHERAQVLGGGNRTGDGAASEFRGVHQLVAEQAARTPEAPAVVRGDESITYRQLVDRARALAVVLRSRGVGPESRVALSGDGTPHLFVGLLAVLMAGGAYVPLDPGYPAKRLEYMIEDSAVELLLAPRALLDRLPPVDVPILHLDEEHEPPVPAPALPEPCADRLAYIIYTSGSTGRPKGVMVEHRGLVEFDAAHRESLPPHPGRRVLLNASISFDVSTWEWMMALTTGAALVVAPREELRPGPPLVEAVNRERVTALSATPSVLATMDPLALPTVTELTSVGEAISAELVRSWAPGRRVVNAYGPTESTVFCTAEVCVPDGRTPPVGRALPGTELYVLDDALHPVPPGVTGELYVGGTGVTRGYQGRPELTADRYLPHPFSDEPGARVYRTGDRVRWDRQGVLHYLGRADHQVKIRGVRTEPEEVREVLLGHPDIREAVVLARPGHDGALALAGYAVPYPEPAPSGAQSPVTVTELRAHLAERLPAAMVPSYVVLLDAFPLNPNGKVDRERLPAPESPPAAEGADLSVLTPTERAVRNVWRDVLGVEPAGADSNFFELGGHSLLAVRASARLREHTGVDLPLRELFDGPTLGAVAARLDERAASAGPARIPGAEAPGAEAPGAEAPGAVPRRTRDGSGLPLSSAQQRLWFVEQLRPGDLAYRISGALHLDGPLDTDILRTALREVVRRHEALRTVFTTVEGEPLQRVTDGPPEDVLPPVDLTGLAPSAQEDAWREEAERFAAAPFDLERSPLHSRLLTLAEERHVVLLSAHHIAVDGWSMRLVVSELAALYTAFVAGEPSPLPEPDVQYPDFAAWQRDRQRSGEGEAALAHWERVLDGSPPALHLPTDRPRQQLSERRAARVAREVGAGLVEELRSLAIGESATLSMALLTAFNAVLSRWSGQDDVLVGMPVAGRTRKELERSVGLFVNTVVVRTGTGGDPGFRDLLGTVRRAALDADAYQDVPFERIVEQLAPRRDLTRTPLFQVLFNMLTLDEPEVDIPGVRAQLADTEDLSARFDLTLYARPRHDGAVTLDLVYDSELFDETTAAALLDQVRHLLACAVDAPDRPLEELPRHPAPTLPDPERELPKARWQGAVHERFAHRAAERPDAVALGHPGGELTYRELADAAEAWACELREAGIGPGDRVVVQATRSAELVVAVLAALRAGAAFSLLDRAHPPARRAACAEALGAAAWLEAGIQGPPEVAGPPVSLARTIRMPGPGAGHPDPDPDPDPDREAGPGPGRDSDSAEPAHGEGLAHGAEPVRGEEPVRAEDLAYIAFTSGTTDRPKGVLGSHAPLAHFVDWYTSTFEVGPEDRFALTSGISHDPLLRDLFVPLAAGARLHVPGPTDTSTPETLADWLSGNGITLLHLTPPMARFLSGLPDGALPSLRYAFFGGDTLTGQEVATMRRLAPRSRLVNFYGATETPQAPAWHPVDEAEPGRDVPLGAGTDGAQLLVVRGTRQAAVGELGEIVVRSPYLAEGYLEGGEPDRAAARFSSDPAGRHGERRYRTGDLGRYRPDGTVVFAGRGDRQIKVRGHRVDLGAIERVLREHPAVTGAVATAVRDGAGETAPAAWVTADGEIAAVELRERLRDQLRGRLPEEALPSTVSVVDAFPLTPNGKIDVERLGERPPGTGAPREPARAPASGVESAIDAIWRRLLAVDHIGREDTFFALGGHSLLLVRLQALLREELHVDVPVVELFRYPTVPALARAIDGRAGQEEGERTRTADAARDRSAQRARRRADRRRRVRREHGDG